MKWLALLLLVGNVVYLGWEIDRETKALVANNRPAIKIPAGTATLKIIDESTSLRELKSIPEWYGPRRVLVPVQR